MADQGKWFKLWCLSLNDPDLENLALDDWARWVRLGVYTKAHGKDGKIRFSPPYKGLLSLFQLGSITDAIKIIKKFPHCTFGERENTVTSETNTPVTLEIEFDNWLKYQGDFSGERVRKFRDKKRQRVTAQEEKRRRREETRREEILTSPPAPSAVAGLIDLFHSKLTDALKEAPTNFNGGALGRTLKAALQTHPVEDVKGRIDNWFLSTDPFIVANAFSPTLFASKFPILKGGPIHAGKSATNPHVRLAQNDTTRRNAYAD